MMAIRRPIRFKAADIWETPEDGNRYEVIDGALYVTPPPGWSHQYGLGKLYLRVGAHVYGHDLGKVVQAPIGVVLDDGTAVEPDLVYLSTERLHLITERGVMGAPDLVVEVLSPKTRARDRGLKLRRYAAAGVPHYWIVDPRTHTLEAYRLGESGYAMTGVYGPGEVFRPDLFPGLEIPIDDLWA